MKFRNFRIVHYPQERQCTPIGFFFRRKVVSMANGSVTRTVFHAKAFAWKVDGTNDDGSPHMVRVGDVEFDSTAPSKTEAYHTLKNSGFQVSSKFVGFEVLEKNIYCQSLEVFMKHGVIVDRAENGRILKNVPEV